jgi:hypothetical protein
MNIQNETLLNSVPGDPSGYVTKDGMWAAIPWGKKFVIIHNGQQVHTTNNYNSAKTYIQKSVKGTSKKKTSTVEQFFS